MPRNSSGVYSKPAGTTAVAGTPIDPVPWNSLTTDLGNEITNSFPRDGSAPMVGQFQGATGSQAVPSFAFTSDPTSGFYYKGSNTVAVVAGGVEIIAFGGGGSGFSANGNVLGMSKWELVGAGLYTLGAASTLNLTNLSAYKFLRINASLTFSTATPLYFRTSTNNGSTWDQGATDYFYQTMGASGTSVGAASTNASAALVTLNPTIYCSFETIIYNFNAAQNGHFVSKLLNNQTPNLSSELNVSQRSSIAARNALQLIPTTGTMNGTVLVEGLRG